MEIKRGDIFYADLGKTKGSEQNGIRPVLIVQNDLGNKFSPTVIAVAITTKKKNKLPTHIPIKKNECLECNLPKDSIILVEQIRTLDKTRLMYKVGKLDKLTMQKVKEALKVSFNIRAKFSDIFYDW